MHVLLLATASLVYVQRAIPSMDSFVVLVARKDNLSQILPVVKFPNGSLHFLTILNVYLFLSFVLSTSVRKESCKKMPKILLGLTIELVAEQQVFKCLAYLN